MNTDNIVAMEDPYMRALLLIMGKKAVKNFLANNSGNYHKAIEMACFLVANGILEFGSNDNKRPKHIV